MNVVCNREWAQDTTIPIQKAWEEDKNKEEATATSPVYTITILTITKALIVEDIQAIRNKIIRNIC